MVETRASGRSRREDASRGRVFRALRDADRLLITRGPISPPTSPLPLPPPPRGHEWAVFNPPHPSEPREPAGGR